MNEDKYELPEGWVWMKIGDLSSVITKGSTPTSYGFEYQDKGILFVKVENISNYSIKRETISQYISRETYQFLKRSQLQENDMLFSIAGTIGRVALVKKEDLPANTNQALAIIRIPDLNIHKKYLLYYLDSRIAQEFVRSEMRGVGIYNISLENVKDIDVPLPPLSEQKRIVEKIESLFDRLNKTKQSLAKIPPLLKKFRQSVLAKAFSGELTEDWRAKQKDLELVSVLLARIRTERKNLLGKKYTEPEPIDTSDLPELPDGWEWVSLEMVAEIVMGQSPPSSTYNKNKQGLPFFQGKAEFGEIHPHPVKWCREPKKVAETGDILISVRAPVGPTNLADQKCCIGRGLAGIRSLDTILSEFILHYLRHVEEDLSKKGQGSTFTAISCGDLRILPFPLPSLQEQSFIIKKISEFFFQADAIEKSVKLAQAHCEKLTQSILAKAFRGELVNQDPNGEPIPKSLKRVKDVSK